jgi:hypothetical protein
VGKVRARWRCEQEAGGGPMLTRKLEGRPWGSPVRDLVLAANVAVRRAACDSVFDHVFPDHAARLVEHPAQAVQAIARANRQITDELAKTKCHSCCPPTERLENSFPSRSASLNTENPQIQECEASRWASRHDRYAHCPAGPRSRSPLGAAGARCGRLRRAGHRAADGRLVGRVRGAAGMTTMTPAVELPSWKRK